MGAIMGSGPAATPLAAPPPAVMPVLDQQAVNAAKAKQALEASQRSGRAATILTQTDKLG